jgi:hypothetical protein
MERKLYQVLASTIEARRNCAERMETHSEWFEKHGDTIDQLVLELMPSGSGIDTGTAIDLDTSHGEKLVFHCSYHHMNDGGMYDGWTEHTITVTPSFSGLNLRISGRNRNEIKDYLYETVDYALQTVVVWNEEKQRYQDIRYTRNVA